VKLKGSSTAGVPPAGQAYGTSTAATQAKPTALGITGNIIYTIDVTYSSFGCCDLYLNDVIAMPFITDKLSPNHLQKVLDLVWGARTQYYSIGLALDLSANTIDAIEKANNNMPDPTFRKVINECLKQGSITQKKLAEVVSSPQVSFAYLSDAILAEKFTPK
jgi:ABC-type amino acid transport substrate-binding protein